MRTQFWDTVCQAMPLVRIVILVELVLGVLLLYSAPSLSPGSGTYYVAGFAGVIVLVTLLALTAVYWRCQQWQKAKGIDGPDSE